MSPFVVEIQEFDFLGDPGLRRRNTYVLFNLERSHDSIFIENREVVL
jgi:hypothetical protein